MQKTTKFIITMFGILATGLAVHDPDYTQLASKVVPACIVALSTETKTKKEDQP